MANEALSCSSPLSQPLGLRWHPIAGCRYVWALASALVEGVIDRSWMEQSEKSTRGELS
jgi:hypothetical protein